MDVDALLASPPLTSLDPDVISFLRESLASESSPSEAAELLQPFLADAELADEQQKLRKENEGYIGWWPPSSKEGLYIIIYIIYIVDIPFLAYRGFQPKPSFATATGKGDNPARSMQKILKEKNAPSQKERPPTSHLAGGY